MNAPIPAAEAQHFYRVLADFFQRIGVSVLGNFHPSRPEVWKKSVLSQTEPLAKLTTPVMERLYRQGGMVGLSLIFEALRRRESGKTTRKSLPSGSISIGFDVFRPEVKVAIQSAAFDFAQSTLGTAVNDIDRSISSLREELSSGLESGDDYRQLVKRVSKIFNDPKRAAVIALSESSRAMHAGELMAVKTSGVVKEKEWLATAGACQICASIDGKKVPLDEPFYVHSKGNPSYRVIMHPPLHPRCWCTQLMVIDEEALENIS